MSMSSPDRQKQPEPQNSDPDDILIICDGPADTTVRPMRPELRRRLQPPEPPAPPQSGPEGS